MKTIKAMLFLCGSITAGVNLGMFLHELGHGVAMWLMGGVVDRIAIHPFSWSYIYYASIPRFPQLATWGGVGFGTLFVLAPLVVVLKRPCAWWGPIYVMAAASTLFNGLYFIIDSTLDPRGHAIEC
ncbi:MAG: hypothetical protein EHM70_16255, partial [Chloroflexota bacterium]